MHTYHKPRSLRQQQNFIKEHYMNMKVWRPDYNFLHIVNGPPDRQADRRATMSISTSASRARPVTPMQVRAGSRSVGK